MGGRAAPSCSQAREDETAKGGYSEDTAGRPSLGLALFATSLQYEGGPQLNISAQQSLTDLIVDGRHFWPLSARYDCITPHSIRMAAFLPAPTLWAASVLYLLSHRHCLLKRQGCSCRSHTWALLHMRCIQLHCAGLLLVVRLGLALHSWICEPYSC